MLSSSARIDKSKRKSKPVVRPPVTISKPHSSQNDDGSRKQSKKQHSAEKLEQIHKEEVAAFRRRMGIKLSSDNKHDEAVPDPISSFKEWSCPTWWGASAKASVEKVRLMLYDASHDY